MVGAEAQNSFISPGSSGPEHPVCNISVCGVGGVGGLYSEWSLKMCSDIFSSQKRSQGQ